MKLSIIVPVYNVEKYLSQCLDSLINQTNKEIEIITVNDGSTDSSGSILGTYSRKDSRIKIIEQENGGLSAARNVGLSAAKGDYILFLDSDDYISTDTAQTLYDTLLMHGDLDIITFSRYIFNEKVCIEENLQIVAGDEIMTGKSFLMKAIHERKFPAQISIKIFSKKLLTANNLTFVDKLLYEDLLFCISAFLYAERVVQIPRSLQFYRRSVQNSITGSISKKDVDVLYTVKYTESLFVQTGNDDVLESPAWHLHIFSWVTNATLLKYPITKFFSRQGWINCRIIKKDPLFKKYTKRIAFGKEFPIQRRIMALLIHYNLFLFYCIRRVSRPFVRKNQNFKL